MSDFVERATDEEVRVAKRASENRSRRTVYFDEAGEARANPGVWFKMHIVSPPGARMRAYQISTGQLKSFKPSGAFEAHPQGRNRVLFRFIGALDNLPI